MYLHRMALLLVLAALVSGERREPDEYAVWLTAEPVGPRLPRALRGPTGRVRLDEPELQRLSRDVEATQQPVRKAIQDMGLPITGATRHILNAIFVEATSEQADRLHRLAGVRAVVRMQRYKRLLNTSAELMNTPAAWTALGGISRAGAGLKIGIVDSGIDQTHPGLQDPSLTPPAGYPRARPEDLPFTNNKVIVARSYLRPRPPIDAQSTRPDDYSPRDRSGHGTFVAMIAAGRTVTAVGGPTITGIAPAAFLGNYKVLGSTDINDFGRQSAVLQALDDSVSDGMDIMSLSIGGVALYAPNDKGTTCSDDPAAICDPLAEAVRIATDNFGMVVVTAAGNDGARGNIFPTLNTISSPGTAAGAISVGSTTNSRQLFSTLRAGSGAPSSLQSVPALFGNGPQPQSPLTAPIRNVESTGNDGFACSALPGGSLTGVIVLVRRGNCDFEDKVLNAQSAGAVAMVVYNRAGIDFPIIMTGLVNAAIPAVMIGNSDGNALRGFIGSTANATVTLDPQLVPISTTPDRVADFSSRGPSIDMAVKPDVVAPGVAIFSATQKSDPNGSEYDPTGFTTLEGTSFSAPMVAGAAALAWQRNRSLKAPQIKSAVVNTASPSVLEDSSPARGRAMGAGKLNARAALDPGATAEPVTISFGAITNTTTFPINREIVLTNVGSSADTFRIEVQQRDSDSNARVTVNGGSSANIPVPAGQNSRLAVALTGSLPRQGFYEGVIRIQGSSGPANLRIPYHYAVGSGRPTIIYPIEGDGSVGTAGQPLPELLIFKLVDDVGLPVPNMDVQFRVTQGGGKIVEADARTDRYGIAAADPDLGPDIGDQTYTATAGGLTVTFLAGARPEPKINDGGIVNGASFARGRSQAPGSILSIFGSDVAEVVRGAIRLPLPLALGHTSVSFDHPDTGLSVPGRLFFVSPSQINVQLPWEFAGLTFALVKVRINDSVSAVYRLELSDYSPGIFEYQLGGQKFGAIIHANGKTVTESDPAQAGETVSVYATGVGPVDQPQVSGEAPVQPLVRTRQTPTVTVAGQNANVQFSGLAPLFVGLNQINVTIPSGVRSGVQQMIVTSNGIPSNTVNIPIQ